MANWNTPNNSEPAHENVLKALADKDTYSLTMGQAGGVWTNLPVGSMLWNNSAAYFQRWNGLNAIPVVISVAGGGTGASTAAQARSNLGVNDAGNLTTGTLPTERLTGTYNISISGNAATATNAANAANSALLQGNNAAFYRNASNLNAGTVPAARLPLNNTVTSTSTTQAATANAVKTAYDRAATQLGGGSVSGVYYNEAVVNLDEDLAEITVKIVRVGSNVTINMINPAFVNFSGKSTRYSNNSILPAWARPPHDMFNLFNVSSAGAYLLRIVKSGGVGITTWSMSTGDLVDVGFVEGFAISYNV